MVTSDDCRTVLGRHQLPGDEDWLLRGDGRCHDSIIEDGTDGEVLESDADTAVAELLPDYLLTLAPLAGIGVVGEGQRCQLIADSCIGHRGYLRGNRDTALFGSGCSPIRPLTAQQSRCMPFCQLAIVSAGPEQPHRTISTRWWALFVSLQKDRDVGPVRITTLPSLQLQRLRFQVCFTEPTGPMASLPPCRHCTVSNFRQCLIFCAIGLPERNVNGALLTPFVSVEIHPEIVVFVIKILQKENLHQPGAVDQYGRNHQTRQEHTGEDRQPP